MRPKTARMKYSVCFKDARGITERSEVTPFPSDADALSYARAELSKNAIVEVWKGDNLLARLFRDHAEQSWPAPAMQR